ncbi:hypothetical protein V2J09_018397, partial [Rumex salicifolius]
TSPPPLSFPRESNRLPESFPNSSELHRQTPDHRTARHHITVLHHSHRSLFCSLPARRHFSDPPCHLCSVTPARRISSPSLYIAFLSDLLLASALRRQLASISANSLNGCILVQVCFFLGNEIRSSEKGKEDCRLDLHSTKSIKICKYLAPPMDEAEHNLKEGSSNSSHKESINSSNIDSAPSADDLAWADSCLMKFTEASDSDWSSFTESLLEILNVPTDPVSLMAADIDNNDHMELGDNHTFSSGQSVEAALSMMTDDHSDEGEGSIQEEEDNDIDVRIGRKKKKWLKGKNLIEDALLPDHSEFAKVEDSNLGFDLGSSSFEPETSSDSIFKIWDLGVSDEQDTSSDSVFKVWDLGVSDEQDEFTNALGSVLGEPKSGAADGCQDLAVEQLDHVIAGMSGLSLGQSSK